MGYQKLGIFIKFVIFIVNKKIKMKKFILSVVAVLGLVGASNAQMVVDAEMFKANPTAFMGKVVTIKNVVLKSSNCHTPGLPKGGVVSTPSGSAAPTPVGVAGPVAGPAKSAHCNPVPNMTLTKWTLGPNNDICVQVDARVKPMLDQCEVGAVIKSISFRCTPTMYVATRIEK